MNKSCIRFAIAALTAVALLISTTTAAPKPPKKTKMDTPTITCGAATEVSIEITVCAGATGASAGFSLQWMTAADYALGPDGLTGPQDPDGIPDSGDEYDASLDDNTWFASDDARLCKASFSGNANISRYNLGANECVTVVVGEFLIDEGASTNCGDNLACGTEYVFRAFAHASSSLARSDFTANRTCSTLDCDGGGGFCVSPSGEPEACSGCTYTQGYWKSHGPDPTGNNSNEWPTSEVVYVGSVAYDLAVEADQLALQAILDQAAAGDFLYALAHQLIAAQLNILDGASLGVGTLDAINGANALIESKGDNLSANLTPTEQTAASTYTTTLRNYNEGATGPGHCD